MKVSVDGGYDEYRDSRAKQRQAAVPATPATSQSGSKQDYISAKEELANKRKAERARKKNEERAAVLEQEIEALQGRLFGEAATDYVLAAELQSKIDEAEEELLSIYEALEEA